MADENAAGTALPAQPPAGRLPEARRWLLLVYRINAESSGQRTYAWRRLRQLGAIYLQQAVAVLPDRPDLRDGLDQLGARIRQAGGEASLLETTSPSRAWEEDLVARFDSARDAEYDELIESVERYAEEIRRESANQRFRFAELEESEADWQKLRRWFARTTARDFFGAAKRGAAEEALSRGRLLLDDFTREVYRAEGLGPGNRAPRRDPVSAPAAARRRSPGTRPGPRPRQR